MMSIPRLRRQRQIANDRRGSTVHAEADVGGTDMSITVTCTCGKSLLAEPAHFGRKAKCPGCGQIMTLPSPADPAPAAGDYRCSTCGRTHPLSDVYDDGGRIICKTCWAGGGSVPAAPVAAPVNPYAVPGYAPIGFGAPGFAPMGFAPAGFVPVGYLPQLPKGMAVASMVLGICSLALCHPVLTVPCALLAIIFGSVAKRRVSAGVGDGAPMATAGIVCGTILLVIWALVFAGIVSML